MLSNGSCKPFHRAKNSATVEWRKRRLNPSKSFVALKKDSPGILSSFERSFSKKMGKTPSALSTGSEVKE